MFNFATQLPMEFYELASIIVFLSFLVAASIYDLKTREIPDRLWVVFGVVGLVLLAVRITADPSSILLIAISIVTSIIVAFGFVYLGLFGGADAKAVICLALALPLVPTTIKPAVGYLHPFFPIMVVLTAFACSLSIALWMGLKNLATLGRHGANMFQGLESEPWWKKALAFVTGYPATLQELNSTFYLLPMEEIVKDSNGVHRRLAVYVNADTDRDKQLSRLNELLQKHGSDALIWVTPALPMLLFILIGAVITITVGDPIFAGLIQVMGR